MANTTYSLKSSLILAAALEGLELQKQRIEAQIQEIRSKLSKRQSGSEQPLHATKRVLTPDARKRIAAAQKRRWAEYRKSKSSE